MPIADQPVRAVSYNGLLAKIAATALVAGVLGACAATNDVGAPSTTLSPLADGAIQRQSDGGQPAPDMNGADMNGADAGDPGAIAPDMTVYDPLEDINRVLFQGNQRLDRYVLEPLARTYVDVVPAQARQNVTDFLRYLNSPVILANQVLQGDTQGAVNTAERFFINSFVLGLTDLANYNGQGIPYEGEDFGQTLAVWGFDEGPYLVLPLIGPSNLRDTIGRVVDNAADPLTYVLPEYDLEYLGYIRTALAIVDARARNLDAIDELQASSLDFYAATRAVYQQLRDAQIQDNAGGSAPGAGPGGVGPAGSGMPSADDFTFDSN